MIDSARPLAILTEESEHQLGVLRRALKRTSGFALYVVVAKDLGRVEALRRLRAWSGHLGVPDLHFFPEREEGARAVEAFLATKDEAHAPAGAVIPDVEALIDGEGGNALAALNVARDVLGRVIRGALLLVVSPDREGDLARRAPDLFDVRAGTATVEARAMEPGDLTRLFLTMITTTFVPSADKPPRPMAELQAEAALLRTLMASADPPLGALVNAWVKLGREFLEQGEIGEALEMAQMAQELGAREGYTSGVADGLTLEAEALERQGALDKAVVRYEEALALRKQLGSLPALASTYRQLGWISLQRDELNEAQSFFEQALAIREELGDRTALALSYLQLASVALKRGEIDKAQTWGERSLEMNKELGDRTTLALIDGYMATIAQARGELDEAQAWTKKALTIWQELDNRPSIASSYLQLGIVASARRELDEAQEWLEQSLTLQQELGNRSATGAIYYQLGIVAQARGELDKAHAWHQRSLVLAEDLGDPSQAASAYCQLGVVATARGELDKAQAWYEKSLALNREIDNREGMAMTYHQLGTLAQERGKLEDALTLHKQALAIHEELGYPQAVARSSVHLGQVAMMRGELDEAQAWYEKALATYEELGMLPGVALSFSSLGLVAALRGDLAQAIDWSVRAAALPMTGPVPVRLVELGTALGMPAVEASWERVTGQPLPAHVRSYVERHLPPLAPPDTK